MRIQDPRYEKASPESIRALQLERFRLVLDRAWETNTFYRTRWKKAGVSPEDVDSLEDLRRLPTVSKTDFLADQEAAAPLGQRHSFAQELRRPLVITITSGTTGQGREVHAQTAAELAETGKVYSYLFRWAGLEKGDTIFIPMPFTMLAGGRIEYHGALTYGLTALPVGNYDSSEKIELLRRFQPQGIIGITSYLGRLALVAGDEAKEFGLKCVITGGEGSGISSLRRLEELWGAPIFDRYGSTQAGNDHMFTCEEGIGDRSRPGMLHNIDPFVLLEVVHPDSGRQVRDGEQGEVIVTSLYRTDVPIVRCRMGDHAVFHEGRYCKCGRPFMGLEVASITRVDHMKKVKGMNIWPQAVDDAVFGMGEIAEYQVILSSSRDGADVATIQVMTKRRLTHAKEAELRSGLVARLRGATAVRFLVKIVGPGELDVGQWKAKRWVDERAHVTDSGRLSDSAGTASP